MKRLSSHVGLKRFIENAQDLYMSLHLTYKAPSARIHAELITYSTILHVSGCTAVSNTKSSLITKHNNNNNNDNNNNLINTCNKVK